MLLIAVAGVILPMVQVLPAFLGLVTIPAAVTASAPLAIALLLIGRLENAVGIGIVLMKGIVFVLASPPLPDLPPPLPDLLPPLLLPL